MGSIPSGVTDVICGPVALAMGDGYWKGVASGNTFCRKNRRTAKKALADGVKLERKLKVAARAREKGRVKVLEVLGEVTLSFYENPK